VGKDSRAGLLIRPWRAEDADEVYRACQDPEIQRWTTVPRPYLREHAEGFVRTGAGQAWAAGTGAPMGVFDEVTGELLGATGLVRLDRTGGEIGYWTAPWARGQAVATRAARAVARWALGPLGSQRLAWRAEVGNHASRLVALRIGVRVAGTDRLGSARGDGTLADMWTGSLLPGELREPADPSDPVAERQAATFCRPQPTLPATTDAGESFTLRVLRPTDIDDATRACQDPGSTRWTPLPYPYTKENAEWFVTLHAPRTWTSGGGVIYALADADDRYVGSMDLNMGRDPSVANVGFLVAPWARGRGFAPAALRALSRWGFDAFALRRIEWRAYLGNDPSRRVAEKAGFTIEGVARAGCVHRGGELLDAWTGALLATDLAEVD